MRVLVIVAMIMPVIVIGVMIGMNFGRIMIVVVMPVMGVIMIMAVVMAMAQRHQSRDAGPREHRAAAAQGARFCGLMDQMRGADMQQQACDQGEEHPQGFRIKAARKRRRDRRRGEGGRARGQESEQSGAAVRQAGALQQDEADQRFGEFMNDQAGGRDQAGR